MTHKTKVWIFALLGLAPFQLAHAEFEVQRPNLPPSPMVEFEESGRIPGPHDYSTLQRRGRWVEVALSTSGLDPATAYTVWAVVFNHPEYCLGSPCNLADLPINPGHDPRVQAALSYVTGGFSDVDGAVYLEGRLDRTERGIKPTETLFGPGLLDARRAEIHFVLRGHGPDAGNPLVAIGSYHAGCTPTNECSDQQATIHLPR